MNHVASFGQIPNCSGPTENQLLQEISNTLKCLLNKPVCCLVPVTDCAIVIAQGAWGDVSDTILIVRWFDPTQIPQTSFVTVYINKRTNLVVTGIVVARLNQGGTAHNCSWGGE